MSTGKTTIALLLFTASACLLAACGERVSNDTRVADPRPNILLIVADDLGYADLGVHGSDIATPNIDAIAQRGMLFTQFHTAPMCAPTRAMLLSGNNNHVAGMANQSVSGLLGEPYPGYENSLSDRVIAFPRLLQDAGYNTYSVGKWHLGLNAKNSPRAAGFTRSWNMLDGAGSHFDGKGHGQGSSRYRYNDDTVDYPEGRYSTAFYTDQLIEFIDADSSDGKPFFAFAAYTSPHWPLQVPDEYLDLYAGHYDDGYDALRVRRFESLKAAGIVPPDSELPPRDDSIVPWETLSAEQQRIEARKMELYAAMVDNLDDHVGRLIEHLKARGLFDNTLIIFMSDNGAAGEDFYERGPFTKFLQANYDNAYEKMGTAASFVSYGDPWAEAGSAPFSRRKGFTRQGGIVAPLMMAGPGVASRGVIDTQYLTVMDLAPTFLAIAGAAYPEDGSVRPMLGESLRSFLAGTTDAPHGDDYVTAFSHRGLAYLRQGKWKITNLKGPFSEAAFQLFDIEADPGEADSLNDKEPQKREELIKLWREERRRLGILLPEDL